jgi:hypothetical protein
MKKTKLDSLVNTRSLKYGTNSLVLIGIVIVLVILLNMVFGFLNVEWDITPRQIYSITETTKSILGSLDADIRVTYLQDEASLRKDVSTREILMVLQKYVGGHVSLNFIDPDRSPNLKSDLGLASSFNPAAGNIVVQSIDPATGAVIKSKILSGVADMFEFETDSTTGTKTKIGIKAEQVMTGAILFVTSDYTPVVYFTQGHGELSLEQYYSRLGNLIKNANYDVRGIDLQTVTKMPDDCELVVVLAPTTDLLPAERELLRNYVQFGGRVMALVAPPTTADRYPNLEGVLSMFNIAFNYDTVSEKNSSYYVSGQQAFLKLAPLASTFVTAVNKSVVFPGSRSLRILLNQVEGLTVTPLFKTSDAAEAKDFETGAITKGPFTVAAYADVLYQMDTSRAVVFGNPTFAADAVAGVYGEYGAEVLYKSVTWLTGVSDINKQNTVSTKYYGKRLVDITAAQATQISIAVSIVFPLLLFAGGFIVWNKRRHL